MKLIVFALAAIAFSGSSKGKNKQQQPTSPAPEPTIKPPQPQPEVKLSEEEKEDPFAAFDSMKKKVDKNVGDLKSKGWQLKVLEKNLGEVVETAKKLKLEREDLEKSCMALREAEGVDKKELQKREKELGEKKKVEEKANETVKSLNTKIIKAKEVFNEAFDQIVAADSTLQSKASLLIQRGNDIREEEQKKAEEAANAVKDSEKALKKSEKGLKNLEDNPDLWGTDEKARASMAAAVKDAKASVEQNKGIQTKNEAALVEAKANAGAASKAAKALENNYSNYAKFRELFFSKNKKY